MPETLGIKKNKTQPFCFEGFEGNTLPCPRKPRDPQVCGSAAGLLLQSQSHQNTGACELALGVPTLIPLLLYFCVNTGRFSGALSVSRTVTMSCRFLCLVWIYFTSCSLHGKITVQNNKGYFLCHVSGSGLSAMKVKMLRVTFVSDHTSR